MKSWQNAMSKKVPLVSVNTLSFLQGFADCASNNADAWGVVHWRCWGRTETGG